MALLETEQSNRSYGRDTANYARLALGTGVLLHGSAQQLAVLHRLGVPTAIG